MSSRLFVRLGDHERLREALAAPVVGIVLDLEALPEDRKAAGRAALPEFARAAAGAGLSVWLRINEIGSAAWEADVAAVLRSAVTVVLVPKVERREQIAALDALVDRIAPESDLRYQVLFETATGILAMESLLASSRRIASAAFGFGDLARDLGVSWADLAGRWPPLLSAERLRLALISRHLRIEPPWDSVWLDRTDFDGLRRDSEITRRLGYAGRILAFPEHVQVVNAIYDRDGAIHERTGNAG